MFLVCVSCLSLILNYIFVYRSWESCWLGQKSLLIIISCSFNKSGEIVCSSGKVSIVYYFIVNFSIFTFNLVAFPSLVKLWNCNFEAKGARNINQEAITKFEGVSLHFLELNIGMRRWKMSINHQFARAFGRILLRMSTRTILFQQWSLRVKLVSNLMILVLLKKWRRH